MNLFENISQNTFRLNSLFDKTPKLITSVGNVLRVYPKDGKKFTEEEIRKFVGSNIIIHTQLSDGFIMFLNQKGYDKTEGLQHNKTATSIIKTMLPKDSYPPFSDKFYTVYGNVLFIHKDFNISIFPSKDAKLIDGQWGMSDSF